MRRVRLTLQAPVRVALAACSLTRGVAATCEPEEFHTRARCPRASARMRTRARVNNQARVLCATWQVLGVARDASDSQVERPCEEGSGGGEEGCVRQARRPPRCAACYGAALQSCSRVHRVQARAWAHKSSEKFDFTSRFARRRKP